MLGMRDFMDDFFAFLQPRGMQSRPEMLAFIDSEIGVTDKKVMDLGAVRQDGQQFRSASLRDFFAFLSGTEYLCGHNILHHDLRYISPQGGWPSGMGFIDTLYLSPLLFPRNPYHSLLKDDKLQSDELNNPLNDALKAQKLFYDEVNAFRALSPRRQAIYCGLLYPCREFRGFFDYLGCSPTLPNLPEAIRQEFAGRFCQSLDLRVLVEQLPLELAYALALIGEGDRYSITPPWVLHNYPRVEWVIHHLCNTPCKAGCDYCRNALDIHKKLREFFGFSGFRTYGGEPLQERAAQAAVEGRSLLAVFPTGGGKSITFQLPALMAGQAEHGLTVVISPLQSLMKDQVDNLSERGLVDAVTVNGLLSPIERSDAIHRVESGLASLFYLSPEQLRSRTIEKLLLSRNVVRFVIDEAHCFSAWGQDFRVDYLYIGDFIRELQEKKQRKSPIPVSCFTATAKQKVISDIRDYFKEKLGLELELFASAAARENLRYAVLYRETEEEKYSTLRSLVEEKNCPTIIYASRTRRTEELARKLTSDGFPARHFHGRMDPLEKVENQEAFLRGEVQIMVATSAFGMGVDKKDVGLVIHYDISDSLENYIQESGRAGRDPQLSADCYVLFSDGDLDKHFILLNQTKLSISEIQQVWRAMKELTRSRPVVCCSPLEIARQAGWNESGSDIETRVKTAVAALENAGYVKRGRNSPRVYATSILARNMEEAVRGIQRSSLFSPEQKLHATRIVKSLISSRSRSDAGNSEAESRVDYLADDLGIPKAQVVDCVNLMRQEGILADTMDMSAFILKTDTQNRSSQILERFLKLEELLLERLEEGGRDFSLKKLNEEAMERGIAHSSVKKLKTILYYLTIKSCIDKNKREEGDEEEQEAGGQHAFLRLLVSLPVLREQYLRRRDLCRFAVRRLYELAPPGKDPAGEKQDVLVEFSLVGLYQDYLAAASAQKDVGLKDMEDALLYLAKIDAVKLEGGFLVLYNGMEVRRLILDNKIKYKRGDYQMLEEYYRQKIQQIHIVGEYANLMVRDYNAALGFVGDYFQLDFKKFIEKYFQGERAKEIDRNITSQRYRLLFGELSEMQGKIIHDAASQYIVVAAGPGSGKTRVLVHKLAALLTLEDVKHEQLLMVTFSRAAATEFKKRLMALIGNAANFVEIKTFHSYCFDLLGKIGSMEGVEDVVGDAARMIREGEVEPGRIAKTVLVIDEAQDMDENEYALVRALMERNEEMRVIAVGDDDQNIYEFRGSDSRYMASMIRELGAARYEMTENYRSCRNITALANAFARTIGKRMKQAEIIPIRQEDGQVRITRHYSRHLEQPVVEELLRTYKGGSACILTSTNEEALCVLGLLNQRGMRARLIQSMDGISLYNLAEMRFFLKTIDQRLKSPSISDDIWEEAKKQLFDEYRDSACLEMCRRLIAEFEAVNNYTKYRTDLEEFIRESQYEDFDAGEQETVCVSTIHKSKGREFDSVYMLLDQPKAGSDGERRKLYVGITRAKTNLYIHCNTGLFAGYSLPGVELLEDHTQYPEPKRLTLQLTHRDVVLNLFKEKGKKRQILRLRSGMPLGLRGDYLVAEEGFAAARFSKACRERLDSLMARGYRFRRAAVRFIVAWKDTEEAKEWAVLLADLELEKEAVGH